MHKVIALVFAMLFCALAGMPTAAAQSGVTASATINGHNVNGSDASDPVQLRPGQPADVAIELTNDGSRPVEVRQVELAGRVLGLNFFTYATTVDFTVQPGQPRHPSLPARPNRAARPGDGPDGWPADRERRVR